MAKRCNASGFMSVGWTGILQRRKKLVDSNGTLQRINTFYTNILDLNRHIANLTDRRMHTTAQVKYLLHHHTSRPAAGEHFLTRGYNSGTVDINPQSHCITRRRKMYSLIKISSSGLCTQDSSIPHLT